MFPKGQHAPGDAAAPHGEWVDLTQPLRAGMPVFPGDPAVSVEPALCLADDGVEVARLQLGSHTGTHVDAPAHTVAGGRTVDRLRLEELIGDALVLGFEGLPPDAVVTAGMVAALLRDDLRVPARVLVATGWDDAFEDPQRRVHHPVLAVDAAELLWDAGARLLGVDTLNPDPTVSVDLTASMDPTASADPGITPGQARLPVHEVFLGRDGVIVENLTGLARLRPAHEEPGAGEHPDSWAVPAWFGVFPLPFHRGDGAPARAVAQGRPGLAPGGGVA